MAYTVQQWESIGMGVLGSLTGTALWNFIKKFGQELIDRIKDLAERLVSKCREWAAASEEDQIDLAFEVGELGGELEVEAAPLEIIVI